MKTTLTPYLNFNNQAAEAMKFYQSIFGGELTMETYQESGQSDNPDENDLIMHAELKTETFSFLACDVPSQMKVTVGDNVHLTLVGSDEAQLTKYFTDLSEGGHVDMPLAKQFWGDTFGMVTDKFGIHWMINISSQK